MAVPSTVFMCKTLILLKIFPRFKNVDTDNIGIIRHELPDWGLYVKFVRESLAFEISLFKKGKER